MKKIGFIDYYLSEWHANKYPGWMADICNAEGLEYQIVYAWGEIEVSPVDGISGAQWCEQNGVEQCATIEEVCEKSDVILILAPSNPEKHLEYAKVVLPYGKITYMDKTFAPDLDTAKEIFAIAEKYNTPLFSTSALRYSEELDIMEEVRSLMVMGAGSSVDEYIVHLAEMLVKKMGVGAKEIKVEHCANQHYFYLRYEDDREATMAFAPRLPYAMQMTNAEGKSKFALIKSDFFGNLMKAILGFYETGKPCVSSEETLEVMRICQGAVRAMQANAGEWIAL